MLEVVKPKYGKVPQHSHTDTEPIDPALGIVDITRVMSLREDLERSCKDKVLFTQVWPSKPDAKQIDRLIKTQTSPKGDWSSWAWLYLYNYCMIIRADKILTFSSSLKTFACSCTILSSCLSISLLATSSFTSVGVGGFSCFFFFKGKGLRIAGGCLCFTETLQATNLMPRHGMEPKCSSAWLCVVFDKFTLT